MKKILVFGATGMIGHQLWFHLHKQFGSACFSTIRKNRADYAAFKIFNGPNVFENVDVTDFKKVEIVLENLQPTEIINCVGITLRKPEINDLDLTYNVNSLFPHRLARWAQNNNARVIHFSTDCVFDGKKTSPYTESDLPLAEDNYGKSKFLGELNEPHCLTLRFPVIGRELHGKSELLEWALAQRGRAVRGFSEAKYSGVTTLVAAEEVTRLIERFPKLTGLFNVANEPINKLELLQLINKHYDLGMTITQDASYATNKVLAADRYRQATGFGPKNWDQMLADLINFKQINYEV